MKAYSNAYNTYKNNSVNYASKEQLLLMLLDGAVKYAKIGRQAILDNDIQKKHDNIIRTQDIFYELMISLDRNAGGEWADNLYAVYEFINHRLVEANMKKDVKIMDEVIPLIEEIRNLWNEAYKLSVKK
ncbi:MAG: flagellar export chaperone FliS [Clostridium argentinense]|uniref:Flagellar secretion chaperone FliS n=1 Tax=Clostridium faecium TaxID=2762223 RepID=A0ABR8YNX9_9CLOT|nr:MULTISPECIES: flagellar export chaperone FliS [Clostridium]MBD8045959.1 flagellar export chaperone FliS [Clostridium faecium]MBS5825189.1 flagellar export chaperone FliS [Clostridium argentinense]MDU1349509.1 flagellar export chaperone FliS [Clostridium argentinense]